MLLLLARSFLRLRSPWPLSQAFFMPTAAASWDLTTFCELAWV